MSVKRGGLLVLAITVSAAIFTTGIRAQPVSLAGTWKLNVAKSSFSPGPPPKSMTVTYTPAGEGMKITVDMTPATGAAEHWEMALTYDGKDAPVKGNPNADAASGKRIDEFTSESTFKKGGKVTSTNTRVLSKDGKTLTVTSVGTTADGKPRKDVQVLEK